MTRIDFIRLERLKAHVVHRIVQLREDEQTSTAIARSIAIARRMELEDILSIIDGGTP